MLTMNVMKKIRRDKNNVSQVRFTIIPTELLLQHTQRWSKDENIEVIVAVEHGNRRYNTNKRVLEPSFIDLSRGLVAWPQSLVDPITFITTIYKDKKNNDYIDKKWYITIYQVFEKKKKKTLAVCPLNVKYFINSNYEVTLKLKSGNNYIEGGQLKLIIRRELLNELSLHDESDRGSLLSFNSSARVSEDREFEKIEISNEKRKYDNDYTNILPNKTIDIEIKKKETNDDNTTKNNLITPSITGENIDNIEKQKLEQIINDVKFLNTYKINGNENNTIKNEEFTKKCTVDYLENESLSNWAIRVTKGYRSIRISDFCRSWKNGLALCAVIHRYRPDLIPNYNSLCFTNTIDGMAKNCSVAFEAGKKLGITPTMDEREWATLPDQRSVKLYVENLRKALLLDAGQVESSSILSDKDNKKRESDHRISSYLQLTETEKNITEEFAKLKREREEADAVDYRNVPEISEEDLNKKVKKKEILADEIKLHKISNSKTDIRREEAKQLLEKAAKEVTEDMDSERRRKLTEEAKKLINDALDDSSSPSPVNGSGNLKRTASIRSTNGSIGGGSTSDLRNLSLASRDFSFRKFKKINPSPSLSKKTRIETPIIPACSRPSRKISNQGSIENLSKSVYMPYPRSQSQSRYSSQTSLTDGASGDPFGVWDKFDKFKRYGSMRGQELAGNISEYLKKNSFTNLTNIQPIAPSNFFSQYKSGNDSIRQASNTDTPTRKLVNKWEKDIHNIEKISQEQHRIQERLNEIEYLEKALRKKMVNVCPGSSEESTLITQILEFTTEKDKLVLEQDYFNALENLRDVSNKITKTQNDLVQVSSEYEDYKQEKDKLKMDSLMKELKNLMDEKDELTQNLIFKEDEEDETLERSRLTLERGSNFRRGNEQPISASKRIFNWIKS
ncbi:EH domain-binding protein 1 [Strongyloides ratti]|uniref:EH domain-binding protein 1 n=1 Tax=Strongyloides ratti TaxID=34506 RepID=A0A090MTU0_STRRB|nr:EH domain-binding protein 1 [Strongyloides ratti]CEF61758.1 EH domain-binding protein 1 [Strongyloides ratti]